MSSITTDEILIANTWLALKCAAMESDLRNAYEQIEQLNAELDNLKNAKPRRVR